MQAIKINHENGFSGMRRTFNEALRIALQNQVRYLHKNGSINATAVARDLNVTPTTVIRMLERDGYSPRQELLSSICALLNVTGDQIMGNQLFSWEEGAEDRIQSGLTNLPIEFIKVFTLKELNNYKTVHQAVNDKAHSEETALPQDFANPEHMLLIRITDDSMAGIFSVGDLVLVDLHKTPSVGDKVLAQVENEDYLIRTLGDENLLFPEKRILASKQAKNLCGSCTRKISIEKL